MSDQIKCPKCGTQIELTEALTSNIEQVISARYEAEFNKKQMQLDSERQQLKHQKKELETQKQSVEDQVASLLKSERAKLTEQIKKQVLDSQSQQLQLLQEELQEKRTLLSEANKKEAALLKKQQELEDKSDNIDLEIQRILSEERKKIREDAIKQASEDQSLKLREKEDLIKGMQAQIENLKRRVESASQEAQGEALEGQLQDLLQEAFPYDTFEEVKKGARGADILQTVKNSIGKECGKILWESKNTKDFQKPWIEKLKGDQRDSGADVSVIVTVAMPKEIDTFDLMEEVWVTNYKCVTGLAAALRHGLIQLKRSELVSANKENLKDVIYNYITSQEFALHIKAVVNAYRQMQVDLDSEKRSMQRIWKKREVQIHNVIGNVTDIYATIEGLVGTQKVLPDIEPLSLEAVAMDEEE
jgi:hypothetical protein